MASIIYVHTHRFYSEILSFFNQFHQLQSVMNRIREAAAGGMVKELAARGTRLKLDVEAGSPLLILPMSSNSSGTIHMRHPLINCWTPLLHFHTTSITELPYFVGQGKESTYSLSKKRVTRLLPLR